MRKGKYAKSGVATKALILTLSLVLMISATIGGTLAWLMDTDTAVTNTFTQSDIDIELDETTQQANNYQFQMIPGYVIDKDPKVTVKAGSEKCWVFVDVDESANLDTYITYAMADGWTQLKTDKYGKDISADLIYYREQSALTATGATDAVYSVIGYTDTKGTEATDDDTFVNDKVLVKTTVTKQDMDAIDGIDADGNADATETQPTLKFTAYAVQYNKSNDDPFTPAEAWANAQTLNPDSGT